MKKLLRFFEAGRDFEGLRKFALIKTGDRSYCSIGEWESVEHLAASRARMKANLDTFRETLEELGDGVTDAVSGEVVFEKVLTSRTPIEK
jgi:ABC-type long-subunit fatty acid transport system fused permease/ATPase subunit